jgi:hypothetical protein
MYHPRDHWLPPLPQIFQLLPSFSNPDVKSEFLIYRPKSGHMLSNNGYGEIVIRHITAEECFTPAIVCCRPGPNFPTISGLFKPGLSIYRFKPGRGLSNHLYTKTS